MSLHRRKILILGLYPQRMTRLLKAAKTLRKEYDVRVLTVPSVLAHLMESPITRYLIWWVVACWEAARFHPEVLYYFNIPEMLGPGVIGAKVISGAALVLDVRSAWIPILRDRGVSGALILVARWLEGMVFYHSDSLTIPNDALRGYAFERGVNPSKPHLRVPNYADGDIFNTEVRAHSKKGQVVAFSGSLFAKEGVDMLILAMELVPWADLWIFGDGPERSKLENLARKKLGERVRFFGHLEQKELARYLAAADVCVIPLKPSAATEYSTPESVLKFAEYASLGRKIVATSVGGITGRGVYPALPTPEDLAAEVRDALESPGKPQTMRFIWSRRDAFLVQFFSHV